jgi:putative ABC transport system permease protein
MSLIRLTLRNTWRTPVRGGLTVTAVAITLVAFLLLRASSSGWENRVAQTPNDRVITRHEIGWAGTLPVHYLDVVRQLPACGATLGAAITMNGAVAQRRREIGVLRALGFTAPNVLVAFLAEATFLALAGALAGVTLASLLSLSQFSITNDGTGNEIAFPFEPTSSILLRSLLAGALVGMFGGFFALRAARAAPTAAMRP